MKRSVFVVRWIFRRTRRLGGRRCSAIRRGDGEAELLASCYRACLAIARDHALRSLAFPAISTGIYGFPADQAASIAVREICATLAAVDAVILVAFAEPDLAVLTAAGDA